MKNFLQKIFSVKNENIYKIIRILGFKIKIKRYLNLIYLNNKNIMKINDYINNLHKDLNKNIVEGTNNKIIVAEEDGQEFVYSEFVVTGLKIKICGNNNIIKLHKPFKFFNNVFIDIGNDDTYVEIGKNCHLENMHLRLCFGEKQKLLIGNRVTIYGGAIVLDEDSQCKIGNDCLMAGCFEVWGSDGHSIYNNKTKELLNRTKNPVIIGDHCWFGLKCTILKNSLIPNNTVIGTSSVVSGNYTEENTIIAGIPARVVKKNINWNDISPIAYNKNIL